MPWRRARPCFKPPPARARRPGMTRNRPAAAPPLSAPLHQHRPWQVRQAGRRVLSRGLGPGWVAVWPHVVSSHKADAPHKCQVLRTRRPTGLDGATLSHATAARQARGTSTRSRSTSLRQHACLAKRKPARLKRPAAQLADSPSECGMEYRLVAAVSCSHARAQLWPLAATFSLSPPIAAVRSRLLIPRSKVRILHGPSRKRCKSDYLPPSSEAGSSFFMTRLL
jgi:hypothetical protein